jgi:hypothetical protein
MPCRDLSAACEWRRSSGGDDPDANAEIGSDGSDANACPSRHCSDERERNLKNDWGSSYRVRSPHAGLVGLDRLFLANDPGEEILHARHDRFLGPGGPDDPFANDPYDD